MVKYKSLHHQRPTGKCIYCGESTKLLIHQKCGKRYRKSHNIKKPHRAPKKRKYTEDFIDYLLEQVNRRENDA